MLSTLLAFALAGRPPVRLVPLAPKRLAHCRKAPELRPACPRLVPRVNASFLSHLSQEAAGGRFHLTTFDLERGGEYPDHPERNRPPRMAHLAIAAGAVNRVAAGVFERRPAVPLRDRLMYLPRRRSLSFGVVRWSGRRGELRLAPGYPVGGWVGNHLIFRWRSCGRRYLVSLHAWEPLTEAAATLRAVVASLPRARC